MIVTRRTTSWTGVLGLVLLLAFLPRTGLAEGDTLEPIRIGATVSLSGKYSEPSGMIRQGYLLWVEQVNERGGLLGRPVELVLHDDASDPATAERLYRQLIDEEGVDLLLAPCSSPLTIAVLKVTEPKRKVLLATAASSSVIWDGEKRFVFGMYALADRAFVGLMDLFARRQLETVAVFYEDSPYHRDGAAGAARWALRFGLTVEIMEGWPPGQPRIAPLLQRAADADVDALIVSAYPPDSYALAAHLEKMTWRPDAMAMTTAAIHPDFPLHVGGMSEGVFAPSHWEPDDRVPYPGSEQFIRDFRAAFDRLPSYHAGSAFASCQVLERTVIGLQSLDHERLRDFIASLETVTVMGRFKVDHAGCQIGHSPIIIQWQDGKKEIVYPTKMQTAPPRWETAP